MSVYDVMPMSCVSHIYFVVNPIFWNAIMEIVFFTLQCELFASCNVSNNASLVSARTGGGGVINQMWTGLDMGRGWWVPKIPKFVWTSFMDDPL